MAGNRARLIAASLAFCAGAAVAAGTAAGDKAAQRKALHDAVETYNRNKEDCRKLTAYDRKVCFAEARAAYRKAEANAVAEFRATPRARMDADTVAASADLSAARARCGNKTGELKDACLKDAKEAQRKAVADAVRKEKEALAAEPRKPATHSGTASSADAGTAGGAAAAAGTAGKAQ